MHDSDEVQQLPSPRRCVPAALSLGLGASSLKLGAHSLQLGSRQIELSLQTVHLSTKVGGVLFDGLRRPSDRALHIGQIVLGK